MNQIRAALEGHLAWWQQDNPFNEEVVQNLADAHDHKAAMLSQALKDAYYEYQNSIELQIMYADHNDVIPQLKKIAKTVEKAKTRWSSLPEPARLTVSHFVGHAEYDPAVVDERFDYLIELLKEFATHYGRTKGNPGSAQIGAKRIALQPLQAFVDELYRYWQKDNRGSFGHEFDQPHKTHKGWKPVELNSDALKFVHGCIIVLEPNIEVATCASLVKNAKRDAA